MVGGNRLKTSHLAGVLSYRGHALLGGKAGFSPPTTAPPRRAVAEGLILFFPGTLYDLGLPLQQGHPFRQSISISWLFDHPRPPHILPPQINLILSPSNISGFRFNFRHLNKTNLPRTPPQSSPKVVEGFGRRGGEGRVPRRSFLLKIF